MYHSFLFITILSWFFRFCICYESNLPGTVDSSFFATELQALVSIDSEPSKGIL